MVTGQKIPKIIDAERDTGIIMEKNNLKWNSFKWPVWTGKTFISAIYSGLVDPEYFEPINAKMPWQSMPNNTNSTFTGWDTRFDTGSYELSQHAGESFCSIYDAKKQSCTQYQDTQMFIKPNTGYTAVTGGASWKLPY